MGGSPTTPVAIIGMACRLPGGISSPGELWEALLRGDDLVTTVPLDRWDAEEYYDPEPGVPGRSVSKWGAFIDDVAGFDADFFNISDREATAIDPQHRLVLETAWEAVEHAGIDPASLSGSLTGVFVGMTHGDYQLLAADAHAIEGPYGFTGNNFSLASGRVSYHLGAHGPSYTVDSACSSSLLAIHNACRSLHEGESDGALAGGVSIMLEPRKMSSGSAQGMLSPTGHCHAFDVAADGFVSAEASVMFMMKRLDDAQRDGDRILAVIRGTASNQDGHTVNIATPGADAQVAVYKRALDVGGVDPATVGYIEAHGTGTPVGDPIEYSSLATVYGIDGPVVLGSAKSNFGHAQSASGAVGLMKAVLSLQHGEVPKNLHFNEMPAEMAAIKTGLFVPTELVPWPATADHPRRAAVSAYGLSGTNVHAVVEQAPAQSSPRTVESEGQALSGKLLFPVSSTSAEELRRTAGKLADWAAAKGDSLHLGDTAYTLARRRAHRPVRTAVLAEDPAGLVQALRDVADGDAPYQRSAGKGDLGAVWVFSGQGSQWAAMGAGLLATEPVFAATIAEIEPLIAAESGFSLTEAITSGETVTGIDRIQPAVFAIQVALAATLKSYGALPGAVIGHSMGESAAAVVSGALSLADGVKVICRRSNLMLKVSGSGAMASVELPAQQVLSELGARGVSDVVLAVVASPQSTVVGGDKDAIRNLVKEWDERGVMAREVAVDVASHTPQVDPILDELAEALEDLEPDEPKVPYYSATQYDPRDPADYDADYWVDNLRHTVRFGAAVQAALDDGFRVFIELAPHPLLVHAVNQNATSQDIGIVALAAMRREQDVPNGLREVVADLHIAGAAMDFSAVYPDGALVDVPLPTWTRTHLILTRDPHEQAPGGASLAVHPLLGAHVRLPEEPERHVWQSDIGTGTQPWLGDHQVHNVAALPGAAYCEMALGAAREVLGEASEVRGVTFESMLLLEDETAVSAVATAVPSGDIDFLVETYQDGEQVRRAGATLHAIDDDATRPAYNLAKLVAAHTEDVDGGDLRAWFSDRGIQYGPAFSGLTSAHTAGVNTVLATVALPGAIRSQQSAYSVHPALLDACFQAVAAHPALHSDTTGVLMLPLGVGKLRAYESTRNAHYCYVKLGALSPTAVEADIDVLDEHGAVLLSVIGLRLGTGVSEEGQRERLLNERLLNIEWRTQDAPAANGVDPGRWLLVSTAADADSLTEKLSESLQADEAEVSTMAWPADADHAEKLEALQATLTAKPFKGVVIVTAGQDGAASEQTAQRGGAQVEQLVHIVRGLPDVPGQPARLYVLTRGARTVVSGDVPNLEQGGIRGFMRAIGMEYPAMRPTQVDLDGATDAAQVAGELLSGSEEDETAWRSGDWYTARLNLSQLQPDERRTCVVRPETDGIQLQIRTPGDLSSAELAAYERVAPGPGQIEVSVAASNLNFADVLVAYGRYPSFEGRLPQPGADFAGVVTAVGPGVTDHQIGDRVAGISLTGAWKTFVTCDANLAVKIPDDLPEGSAAAVPSAHATAWYGLHNLARIQAGDKVLIHSATGGVGQAAIAIARAAGAEIYATAGSDDRRNLLRSWGIQHVYDSRSTAFAEDIRRDTDGYGVDVVLNSLPGAAQRAGVELLTFGGRFVEIGKRDIYGDTRMGLFPFRRNLSFYALDLALLTLTNPDVTRGMLETIFGQIADGVLPVPDTTHYPLSDAATAIRVMGAAGHTGKLVLDIPHTGEFDAVLSPENAPAYRADGSYIVTGGLRGLGLFLAEKLAAGGCGRIVLNARSEPSAQTLQAIEAVRGKGAEVEVVLGDIAAAETAARLVAAAESTGKPLRGVLHGAAVVEDATLPNITDELIQRDWAPKVYGAWYLHEATAGSDLDWFCSFSSAAAMVGSPGQAAYAAANSWLDAFTQWRRAQGLPATAIAWGAWAKIGAGQGMAADDAMAIDPEDGAYAFDAIIRHDRAYAGYAPVAGADWLVAFAQTSKFAESFANIGRGSAGTSEFLVEFHALSEEERPARLRRLITDAMSMILRRSVDPDRPLAEYGLDSLGALELRTRIEAETGVRIGSSDITNVRALADRLGEAISTAIST
ncbi:type I polyketide synthase [Mycobacterium sp. CBMA293]|uniref:sulfolipid-1 biosynthesis phthioceranic/hydroxyphthioceranic acid synthase n=3 Tax=Mycolicibacterium TaxID=1866885 RepID=UPI00132BA97C|nr:MULTISPECIES: type I polyketide synthase [unclassified Mycolicibacterium]MUL46948.1 type I polyketide synthase [Mycolicibacterium sp. CBMA 360]MUL93207.1 type I polyketide synthase [Mycolicibacterium sp. CBMA 230]MUL58324.1 type I polyketide synthase [Mycolicibacterium sp. CBMA 335]MUL73782.1 type I polyketide synthase [Mycolicibacterium sp. CBMA 311]MUM07755.1 polyketide synthase [Mycolicibacterium sp. CBMA 213]